jgi:hypothetical protein
MFKVIRAALIIFAITAFATFLFAQHNHASGSNPDNKTTCSCCAGMKDGQMAACCDAEKCKMDEKGNCTTGDCCKKTGGNACKKACAKSNATDTASNEGMSCGRKGGCCNHGDAAKGGVQ